MIEQRTGGKSVQALAVRTVSRTVGRPALAYWPLRGPMASMMPWLDGLLKPLPGLTTTQRRTITGPTWTAESVEPKGGVRRKGAVLYLHGGAFHFCGVNTHRRVVHRLVEKTGLPALSVDYRQAPHALVADSLADCREAFDWLLDRGIAARDIVLAGDSAGGHLAFALALQLAREGLRPAGIVAFSPWLDFDESDKVSHPNARKDALIPAGRLARAGRRATGTPSGQPVDPSHSPVNDDLTLLPQVQLHCAADEVLRLDAELMANRLKSAGVRHSLSIWPGMVHAFPVLGHLLPEARTALDESATFIIDVTGRTTSVSNVA